MAGALAEAGVPARWFWRRVAARFHLGSGRTVLDWMRWMRSTDVRRQG